MSVNVAAALVEMAQQYPDRPAIHVPLARGANGQRSYRSWTYRELDQASDHLEHGLGKIGGTRGTRTVLMVKPSLQVFALTFGRIKAGSVPWSVDPGL